MLKGKLVGVKNEPDIPAYFRIQMKLMVQFNAHKKTH
jgi:hypothetical protein